MIAISGVSSSPGCEEWLQDHNRNGGLYLLQGAVGETQLSDLLRGNMNGLQVKKLGLPEFYSRIITEYFRLKPSCQITNAIEVTGQTLWYNKVIQINNDIVFFAKHVPTKN